MDFSQKLLNNINQQFRYNNNKNLFYADRDSLINLSPETVSFMNDNKNEIMEYFERGDLNLVINHFSDEALELFIKSNQYLNFTKSDSENLKNIYTVYLYELHYALKSGNNLSDIVQNHFNRLATWLKATNPFIEGINTPERDKIPEIVCSEYSADLQMNILDISLKTIMEPILDIGCGENGTIVNYLRSNKKAAFGLDRMVKSDENYFIKSNWFEYSIQSDSWGTVICNMSFTNHFIGNHLRRDGNYESYAEKYMEILRSLKVGGKFHYAPGVSFIEQYLPVEKYSVNTKLIEGRINISRTITERLK